MKHVTDDQLDDLKSEASIGDGKSMIEITIIRRNDVDGYVKSGEFHGDETFEAVVDMIGGFLDGVDTSKKGQHPRCLSCHLSFARGCYPHTFVMIRPAMGAPEGQNVLLSGICTACSAKHDDEGLKELVDKSVQMLWPTTRIVSTDVGNA